MEKMAWDGPKWGQEDFFPTNPNLADILGRIDLDFEIFYFFRSHISEFPGRPRAQARPGLGQILEIWKPGNLEHPKIWHPNNIKNKNYQNPDPCRLKCRQGLDWPEK